MDKRIPYAAKGKGIAYNQKSYSNSNNKELSKESGRRETSYHERHHGSERSFSPPPKKRIRAPTLDNSALIRENSLALMGRLTNPASQRLWSLIPFLSNRWNLKGKATGSDLGRGCFQFRFEYEEYEKVLDNRPYHFDQWMVILQRWEPIISPTFPSEIPFWVELQGLPMHYWIKEMLYAIGEKVGKVVDHDISTSAAKIRVLINGLQPLTKETTVEFQDGSEAVVSLDYKNLKSHCHHCLRLSHVEVDCPGLKKAEETNKRTNQVPPERTTQKPKEGHRSNNQGLRLSQEIGSSHLSDFSRNKEALHPYKRKTEDRYGRTNHKADSRSHGFKSPSSRHSPPRHTPSFRREPPRTFSRNNHISDNPNLQWREKPLPRELTWQESSETSRTRRPPLEREMTTEVSTPLPVPLPTKETIMGELREVIVQYSSCADPTESMTRKQRVLQGEARGLMTETAYQILSAVSLACQQADPDLSVAHRPPSMSPSQDLPVHPAEIPAASGPTSKKKRGRPQLNKAANRPGNKSPLRITGVKSSKRHLMGLHTSPKGRLGTDVAGLSTADAREIIKAKQARQQPAARAIV